jgi:uncharacterized protein (TIGR03435 family)
MRLYAFLLFSVIVLAQPARFEVATVRASEPILNQVSVGFTMTNQQLRITALPLAYYLRLAYDVKGSQVIGPPQLQDRFDVSATIPEGVKQDKLNQMLEGMLADRFQLKTHRESREMQVYAITSGKGAPKLQAVPETEIDPNAVTTAGGTGTSRGISVNLGNGASFTFADNKWEGKKLSFGQVADQLEQFVDRPVVDQTGLKGRYDFALDLTLEDYQAMGIRASMNAGFPMASQAIQRAESAQLGSVFEAFEKLGLKLEAKKMAVPVVVVDSVLKVPTEN